MRFGASCLCLLALAASARGDNGQLYNYDTRERGQQYAAAVHATASYADLSIQLQAIQYLFEPKNLSTAATDVVYVGAFADACPIA